MFSIHFNFRFKNKSFYFSTKWDKDFSSKITKNKPVIIYETFKFMNFIPIFKVNISWLRKTNGMSHKIIKRPSIYIYRWIHLNTYMLNYLLKCSDDFNLIVKVLYMYINLPNGHIFKVNRILVIMDITRHIVIEYYGVL